jgi:hypothetical protein
LNAPIAPGGILLGHADHELFDLLGDARSPKLSTMTAPIKLLGDESVIPAQEGVRRGDRGDLFKASATKRVCQRREAPAFCVGEMEALAAKLSFEDTVFLVQVSDDLLLMTLDPTDEHGE